MLTPRIWRRFWGQPAVSIATECMITAHDRYPVSTGELSSYLKVQLRLSFRISHRMENILARATALAPEGLDRTVTQLWNGYEAGSPWRSMKSPRSRWMNAKTSADNGRASNVVHFNLLDGTLLVDGLPLTRLPEKYERHATHRRLFAERVVEVVPSSINDMIFETRRSISGHQIHFSMYDNELIVKTCRDNLWFEYIPPHALQGDFPKTFVSKHVHWLDSNGLLEFRPADSPWDFICDKLADPLERRHC